MQDFTCPSTARSLRRRRDIDYHEPCFNDVTVCKIPPVKINNTSSSSIGALSRLTLSTVCTDDDDDSCQISLSEDIPLEVVIINDDHEESTVDYNSKNGIPSTITGHTSATDVEAGQAEIYDRLKMYEHVIDSYRQKLKSSESLNGSLHKYLRQTQEYAENLTSDRRELITAIEDIEKEDNRRVDQELIIKFMTCSSLFFYFLGGSHNFLVGAAVLQLIVTVVNITI